MIVLVIFLLLQVAVKVAGRAGVCIRIVACIKEKPLFDTIVVSAEISLDGETIVVCVLCATFVTARRQEHLLFGFHNIKKHILSVMVQHEKHGRYSCSAR